VDGLHVDQARDRRERVHHQEIAQVLLDRSPVDVQVEAAGATPRGDEYRDRDHDHRERREHERRAQDRPDADLLAGLVAGKDRDQRQQRLRQRRPDRREHRSDDAFGQPEALAHPLDAVREQLRRKQDHEE
jgi:hypothetical protein